MNSPEIIFDLDLSVVIPLYNEEESLGELCDWIMRVATAMGVSYEIILVNDGSSDASWNKVLELARANSAIKGVSFQRNYGKSAALNEGFNAAKGKVVITMDADLQDSPDEIPELYKMITEQRFDLVSGWKKKRHDPISKTVPTKLFNWATRKMSGIHLHDFNCGLKAYNGKVIKNIEVYGEMHRYIPVLAKRSGFARIGEKEVAHQARKYGTTKYGMNRFVNGFLDLLTISFVSKFSKRPMHFFGAWGTVMFIFGSIATAWLICSKLYFLYIKGVPAPLVADQALFYVALVAMIMGTQLFLTGFLAELTSRNSTDRNHYTLDAKVGFGEGNSSN